MQEKHNHRVSVEFKPNEEVFKLDVYELGGNRIQAYSKCKDNKKIQKAFDELELGIMGIYGAIAHFNNYGITLKQI